MAKNNYKTSLNAISVDPKIVMTKEVISLMMLVMLVFYLM